jgi:hypothetical protein
MITPMQMHGKTARCSGTLDPQEATGPLHHGSLSGRSAPVIATSAITIALKPLGRAIIAIDLVAVSRCGCKC